jgi:hypothetical protein
VCKWHAHARGSDAIHCVVLRIWQHVCWFTEGVWGYVAVCFIKIKYFFIYFSICTIRLLLFCTVTNKCTIISQIITLLRVSTLSCHPRGTCNQYLAKLYKEYNMRTGIKPMWNILLVNCITNSCICNTCVTWQGIDYKLSEDDTIIETCSSVIICEIIVHLLVIVQNKRCIVQVKHLDCKLYYQQLHLKYLCNLARYWLQAVWGWHDSVETCSKVIICEIIVHLLVIVENNKIKYKKQNKNENKQKKIKNEIKI